MPFYGSKSRRNRRFGSKRRSFKKRGPSVKTVNKKVKKIQNQIQTKQIPTALGSTALVETPITFLLNGNVQSDGESGRTGNQCSATSVDVRYTIFTDINNTASQTVRVMCIWDKQPNGAFPTVWAGGQNDSYLFVTPSTPDQDSVHYCLNLRGKARYKVLYDKVISFSPTVGDRNVSTGVVESSMPMERAFHFNIKLNSKKIVYQTASTATIGGILQGAVYLIAMSDQNTQSPSIIGQARFNFKDA